MPEPVTVDFRAQVLDVSPDFPEDLLDQASALVADKGASIAKMYLRCLRLVNGEEKHITDIPLGGWDRNEFAGIAGEGEYRLELRCRGKGLSGNRGSTYLQIDAMAAQVAAAALARMSPTSGPQHLAGTVPAAVAPAATNAANDVLVGLVKNQEELLKRLMDRVMSPPPAAQPVNMLDTIKPMLEIVGLLKSTFGGGAPAASTPIGELAQSLREIKKLAKEEGIIDGGNSDDDDWIKSLKPLLPDLVKSFMDNKSAPAPQPQPRTLRLVKVNEQTSTQRAQPPSPNSRGTGNANIAGAGSGGTVAPATTHDQDNAKTDQQTADGVPATGQALDAKLYGIDSDIYRGLAYALMAGAKAGTDPNVYATLVADTLEGLGDEQADAMCAGVEGQFTDELVRELPFAMMVRDYLLNVEIAARDLLTPEDEPSEETTNES